MKIPNITIQQLLEAGVHLGHKTLRWNPKMKKYIFGKRDVFMITNVLEGGYILNNTMDFSTKIRHYWSGLEYNTFRELRDNGYLENSNYNGNHNTNFNIWTIDMSFNWRFAPGSQMSFVWKNAMENYDNTFIQNWTDNIERTFSVLQQNSLSFKIVYYLDYLYFRKKQ